jgi:hypothetical protein
VGLDRPAYHTNETLKQNNYGKDYYNSEENYYRQEDRNKKDDNSEENCKRDYGNAEVKV